MGEDVEDYVYKLYRIDVYKELYNHVIPSVPSEEFYFSTKGICLPDLNGRKKREHGEPSVRTKLSKVGTQGRCTIYISLCYNPGNCSDKSVQDSKQENQKEKSLNPSHILCQVTSNKQKEEEFKLHLTTTTFAKLF